MSFIPASLRELPNGRPLDVAVVDINGDQLAGFDPSRPANAAITSVSVSTSSVSLLAANADRRQFIIVNTSSKILYVAFGATATTAAYTVSIAGNGIYESAIGGYTGAVSGIWSAADASKSAKITEITS